MMDEAKEKAERAREAAMTALGVRHGVRSHDHHGSA